MSLTGDAVVDARAELHARWHDQQGNMIYDGCGWDQCEFWAIAAFIAERDETSRELRQRELHHFESERAMTEALAILESHQQGEEDRLERIFRAGNVLHAALAPAPTAVLCRDCSEGKHGACIGSAFIDEGPEVEEVACGCPDATHGGSAT